MAGRGNQYDAPVILRIDWNCPEVDRAGNFFKHDGKYYDVCCDFENEDAPECADLDWFGWLIVGIIYYCTFYAIDVCCWIQLLDFLILDFWLLLGLCKDLL